MAKRNENMEDGQTAPGFDEPTPIRPISDDGEQDTYLPPAAPPNFIDPPTIDQMGNATFVTADPKSDVSRVVKRVLAFEDFQHLSGVPYSVIWRRHGEPWIDRKHGLRRYAQVALAGDHELYEAGRREEKDFPRFFIDLFWVNFDNLRTASREILDAPEGTNYLHETDFERHIFTELLRLDASETRVLSVRSTDHIGDATAVVRRYGLVNGPLREFAEACAPWLERGDA